MKKTLVFIFFLLWLNLAFCASLLLVNDSPFELTAIVQAADGSFLGQVTIQPGEQNKWTSDLSPTSLQPSYRSSVSYTPFTVIWRCSHEGHYSMCTDVSPGSTVRANICPGTKYCKPKEEKKEECPPCICPPCEKKPSLK